jgi:ABC-type antimicrobial peptide transport system ATPase subunit
MKLQFIQEQIVFLQKIEQEQSINKYNCQKKQCLIRVHFHDAFTNLHIRNDIIFILGQPMDHTTRYTQKQKP